MSKSIARIKYFPLVPFEINVTALIAGISHAILARPTVPLLTEKQVH